MPGGRGLYAAVAGLYAASRVLLYALGIRFTVVDDWWFLYDHDLLEHRLWESLLHTHVSTPFMYLLVGSALKISPEHAPTLYHGVHIALGLTLVVSLAYLMAVLGQRRWLIVVATALYCCSPPFVYFEHLLLYEFPSAALLALSAVLLHRALTRESWTSWLLFFLGCAAITYVRTTFHFAWLAALVVVALLLQRKQRRVIASSALLPVLLALALPAKNLYLFGFFGTSSWLDFNLTLVTTKRLPESERSAWIARGELSPVADVGLYAGPEDYAPYVELGRSHGIPVLDRLRRSDGTPNYNHASYLEVGKLRGRDARHYLARRPLDYLRTVGHGVVDYFRPTSRWHPRDPDGSPHEHNRRLLGAWEDLYNAVLHGFPLRPFGLYLPLVALLAYAAWSAFTTLCKSRAEGCAREKVVLFMAFNCLYVPAVSCLVTIGELERFRFMVEPLMWTVGLSAVPGLWARMRIVRKLHPPRSGALGRDANFFST